MHNDCLTYDYSICDIDSHLPIYLLKKIRCYVIGYLIIGVPSVLAAHYSHNIIYWVPFVLKQSMITTKYIRIKQKPVSAMFNSENCAFV